MAERLTLPRVCHAGMSGPDVYAYSRTMKQLGIRHRKPSRYFGVHLANNLLTYQKQHHLPHTGHVGEQTFASLRKHFDGYSRVLIRRADTKYQPHARDYIVGACLAMLHHAPFPYREVRPYPDTLQQVYSQGSDCSGTSCSAYKYAHGIDHSVPDPAGFDFSGYGSTYTMITHGVRVSSPEKGDLCFYYATFSHVGVYLGDGKVFSHGKPGDPHVVASSFATQFRRYLPA
jgi:hypothetical protein